MCPGFLARDTNLGSHHHAVGQHSVLEHKLSKMEQTPKHVRFASSPIFSPGFHPQFDHNSFDSHLESISPMIEEVTERRKTRILGRPSFIPDVSACSDFLDEESVISAAYESSNVQPMQVDVQVCMAVQFVCTYMYNNIIII